MKCMLRNQYLLYKTTLAVTTVGPPVSSTNVSSQNSGNFCTNQVSLKQSLGGVNFVYDWRSVTRNVVMTDDGFENVVCSEISWFLYRTTIGEAQLLISTTCMLRNRVISVQNTNVEGGGDRILVPRSGSYILNGKNGWCSCRTAKNNSEMSFLVPRWRIMEGA